MIAQTGKDATSQAMKTKPDLVFLDITMESDRDGISAGLAINGIDPAIMIVFASAYPEHVMIDELKDISYADYLEKPFNAKKINACLKKLGISTIRD